MSNIPELQNVPEVSFIDNLALQDVRDQILQDYAAKYQELTGTSAELSDADPVRLMLLTFAQQFYQGLQYVDWAGKKNLLKYAYGEALDNLAANKGLKRNPGSYATTTLEFSMQNARTSATGIPAGTRVSNLAGVYFMTTEYAEIPAGETSVTVPAEALDAGAAANELPIGSINQFVDPIPYMHSVTNTTTSAGGSDDESDAKLTERVYLYPASYSTAGSEAAYTYWAKAFRPDITDVKAYSPEAGHVAVVVGNFLYDEDIAAMTEFLSAKTIRPLTDTVTVQQPDLLAYHVDLEYYIDTSDASKAITIQQAVEKAVDEYNAWQQTIGRDVNPSQLIRAVMDAGAKRVALKYPPYMPVGPTDMAALMSRTVTYRGLEEG